VARSNPPTDAPASSLAVVGASAGGVEALCGLARGLPDGLPCALLVVLHLAPHSRSVLPEIIARNTELSVVRPQDGELPRAGHIYVAPPDYHLVVRADRLHLSQAPKENGHRPAVDPALRTAAAAYGPATIGVLLSGTRDDGTAGAIAVKEAGGAVAVQDPEEALYGDMPRSALRHVDVDAVLPVAELGGWIARRAAGEPAIVPVSPMTNDDPLDPQTADDPAPPGVREPAVPAERVAQPPGEGTRVTCPDCGGTLFASEEDGLLRFRCSVGHAYSVESLNAANLEGVEQALWTAVRVLEDRVALLERMADRARSVGNSRSAAHFERQVADLLRRAETIRGAIGGLAGTEAA
jgi:two-component system chemotaxis response regulator CheB